MQPKSLIVILISFLVLVLVWAIIATILWVHEIHTNKPKMSNQMIVVVGINQFNNSVFFGVNRFTREVQTFTPGFGVVRGTDVSTSTKTLTATMLNTVNQFTFSSSTNHIPTNVIINFNTSNSFTTSLSIAELPIIGDTIAKASGQT